MARISLQTLRRRIDFTQSAPAVALLLNTLVWYILISVFFRTAVNSLSLAEVEKTGIFVTFFVSIAVCTIIGYKLFRGGSNHQQIWPLLGALATVLLMALSNTSFL